MGWFSNFFGGGKPAMVPQRNLESGQYVRDYISLKKKVGKLFYDPTGFINDLRKTLKNLNSNTDFDKFYDNVKYHQERLIKSILKFEAAGHDDLITNKFEKHYLGIVSISKDFISHLTKLNKYARLASRSGEVAFTNLRREMKKTIILWDNLNSYWDAIDKNYKNKRF